MAGQRRISGGLVAAAAGLGMAAPLVLAGTASAHTHTWTVTCDKVTIDLEAYNVGSTNHVTLTIGTDKVLDRDFPDALKQDFPIPAHAADVTVTLAVRTDQDRSGDKKWTFTETQTSKPCPVTKPSTSPSTSPSVSPPASASTSPSVSPSVPASASPSKPSLAFTGGGGNSGLIAGAGVGVIALGGGVLYLVRRRPSRRH